MADKAKQFAPKHMTDRARDLRKKAPVPERVLWGMLRDRRLAGLKFRRQQVVGPFIVDFYCEGSKLVVELDGLSHTGTGAADDRRTAYLESLGLRVLRVTNDDLLQDSHAVMTAIARAAGVEV